LQVRILPGSPFEIALRMTTDLFWRRYSQFLNLSLVNAGRGPARLSSSGMWCHVRRCRKFGVMFPSGGAGQNCDCRTFGLAVFRVKALSDGASPDAPRSGTVAWRSLIAMVSRCRSSVQLTRNWVRRFNVQLMRYWGGRSMYR